MKLLELLALLLAIGLGYGAKNPDNTIKTRQVGWQKTEAK